MFTVQPFEAKELGNASFVVADPDTKQAVVIDPVRDVDQYLTNAEQPGLKVTHALDTHTHNDFVSGARELKALAGTATDPLHPDEEVTLGSVTIRAMYTPGHKPDHRCYVLVENGTPKALFSGGAVMVGGTARTDLFGPHMAAHLGLESLRTLQVRLRGLPDEVAVYRTHGSGSFCGISGRSSSLEVPTRRRAKRRRSSTASASTTSPARSTAGWRRGRRQAGPCQRSKPRPSRTWAAGSSAARRSRWSMPATTTSGAQATCPAPCTCTCPTCRTTRATYRKMRPWPCIAGLGTGRASPPACSSRRG